MKVYDNRFVDELDEAYVRMNESFSQEEKLIRRSIFFTSIELILFGICSAAAAVAVSGRDLFKFILLCTAMVTIFIVELVWMAILTKSRNARLETQKEYFSRARKLSEYNTDRIVEMMADTEIISMLGKNPEDLVEN